MATFQANLQLGQIGRLNGASILTVAKLHDSILIKCHLNEPMAFLQ